MLHADGSTVYVEQLGAERRSTPCTPRTERENGRFRRDHHIESSPAVGTDAVYVGSDDCKLYALSASDSTLLWSHETGDQIEGSPR